MIKTECVFEREVLRAAKTNQWTSDLSNHAASCPLCQETMAMTKITKKISQEDSTHALPSYRLIWVKAQYVRRQERLSKLDLIALIGVSLVGIAVFAGLLLWGFPQLFAGVLQSVGASSPGWSHILSNGTPLAVILGVLIMVWLLTHDSFFAER